MIDQLEQQQLLNISVTHMRKQGEPSMDDKLRCCYRQGNLQCAAGPFITDYGPDMELKFTTIANAYPTRIDPLAIKHYTFVQQLQSAHDHASSHRIELKTFYMRYELTDEKFLSMSFIQRYEHILRYIINRWNLENKMNLVIPT